MLMILVTGGTGLVGSHLLYKLTLNEEKIIAIYRNIETLERVKNVFGYYTDDTTILFNKIEWIQADITDIPALEIAFQGITNVYHCAANLSFNTKNYEASKATNVIGTANIVNFCLSEKIEKLCYVSSVATLGEDTIKPITETTHWNPENNKNNIYAITKYNAELEVWRGTQEGLNAVIVNPGVIMGAGFWNNGTGEIFSKIANGFGYYTSGSVGIIDVNDVADVMINLMHTNIKNEKFILISENISYQKLVSEINQHLNPNQKLTELKKWQLVVFYQFEKIKYLFLKGDSSLSNVAINSSFKNLNYDASKIKKAISFKFTSVSNSIQQIAKQHQSDLKQKAT